MPRRLPYLPALDGLRAIAVIMVFAYHLEFPWASGGFLGVDVFFVISGYLITRLLVDEHADRGRIGLGSFWIRRFRRLVPAMVAMIAATLMATHRWGLPEQWTSIRVDALAALGYVANWRFVLDDQSYFDASLGPSPLLHTWSLAVEEQWYLLWPIVMIGLCAWAARHVRASNRVAMAVVAAATASAVWMAVLFDPADPSRVYFGTDTRAQQLLIGAALAWILHAAPGLTELASSSRTRPAFAVALGALVATAALVGDEAAWLYRGGLFAISLVAAVVVLGTTTRPGTGLAWLGAAPLVWIGRRSYGIYLWHWPVIIFMVPATGGELGRWPLTGLQVGVTLLLTEVSHRLIESPVRRSTAAPVRTITAWSAAAVAIGALGFVWLTPPAARDLAQSDAAFPELDALTSLPPSDDAPGSLATPPTPADAGIDAGGPTGDGATGARRLLLFGDSAAYTLAEQFELPDGADWDVQAFAEFGCPITPGETVDAGVSTVNPVDDDCAGWVELWPGYAEILEPDVVAVMIGAWEVLDHRVDGVDIRFPSDAWRTLVRDAIADAVSAASTTGVPVVLLDVPCMGAQPDTTARADAERVAAVNELISEVAAARDGVSVAPLGLVICPDGDTTLQIDGIPARYDGVHYTRPGAARVWPWLLDELGGTLDAAATRADLEQPMAPTTMPG